MKSVLLLSDSCVIFETLNFWATGSSVKRFHESEMRQINVSHTIIMLKFYSKTSQVGESQVNGT